MKLKNKKTGEIIETVIVDHGAEWEIRNMYTDEGTQTYDSLAELNAEWEDYEEPKGIVKVEQSLVPSCVHIEYSTKEEAEKAVEKLKAWKRLKDKGFRFSKDWVYRYDQPKVENHTYFEFVAICEDGIRFDDLDLLFGGEE